MVQQCMHCGLCLPTCPTYDATKNERHSPRGRIALMRAIADERLQTSAVFGGEMYFCLGCLACTSACPAGVDYTTLFERARAEVETSRVLAGPRRDAIRWFTIAWLFMDLRRLRTAGRVLRGYQSLGMERLVRSSGVLRLLPSRLQELERMTPRVSSSFSSDSIPEVTPARGTRRFRVAMLLGCAQDILFADVNRDTVEVLARNGCEVHTPRGQSCCGSLHAHNGELDLAMRLARRNIDQFPPGDYDAIISNAGGCGFHLRRYGHLLESDANYAGRAALWDAKLADVQEWLVRIGWAPPGNSRSGREETPLTVAYHESCHLSHGQKVVAQPRQLLRSIPGLRLVELAESNWCCGSAGIYNLTQPEMSGRLLERKIGHFRATGATVLATSNPGCQLQLINGLRERGFEARVAHPVTLLAEAYRAADLA